MHARHDRRRNQPMVLKYTSHVVYCGLLALLLSRVEASPQPDPLLVRFLRAFLVWSAALLAVTILLFDLRGVRYSSLEGLTLRPAALLGGATSVALYALAVAANVGVCVASMWAHRVVFGFPLQHELLGSVALLVAYNVLNLRYNATAFARLEPFWRTKGLDLAKHQRWSLGLGNVGLGFRTCKRVLVYAASVAIAPSVPALDEWAPSWRYPVVWGCVLVLALTPLTIMQQNLQFHFLHAWLHADATLYRLVHKIHHCARYPIPSDSGTESPLEYILDEITAINCLVPFWFWLPGEFSVMKMHRDGHIFEVGNAELASADPAAPPADGPVHHMLHHTKNTGNLSIVPFDKMSGTLIDRSKLSAWVLPSAKSA